MPLPLNLQKEQFSLAYIHAVAAAAGFGYEPRAIDVDSIDLSIQDYGEQRAGIDVQAKCTAADDLGENSHISYPLRRKNYDDLRASNIYFPRFLVIVVVPLDVASWLSASPDQLVLRRCGFWLSLRGFPDRTDVQDVTVQVPRDNVFTPDSLTNIMAGARLRP